MQGQTLSLSCERFHVSRTIFSTFETCIEFDGCYKWKYFGRLTSWQRYFIEKGNEEICWVNISSLFQKFDHDNRNLDGQNVI